MERLTVQEFAGRVKQKYPEYLEMDDSTVTGLILDKYPEYYTYFREGEVDSNFFAEGLKQFTLGAAEVVGGSIEGLSNMYGFGVDPNKVMTREEFDMSPGHFLNMSYAQYLAQHNKQKKHAEAAFDFGSRVDEFVNVDMADGMNVDEEFQNSFIGQVSRGLGQFLGYGAIALTTRGVGVTPAAFLNRQSEFLQDAENTLGKKYINMTDDEKTKVARGSLAYGLATGILEATAFKYATRLGGQPLKLFNKFRKGGKVPEGSLKMVLNNMYKAGIAEGTQESLGDGMVLDSLARLLYDDSRELFTMEALGRRAAEFGIGFTVGGFGRGAVDTTAKITGRNVTDIDPDLTEEKVDTGPTDPDNRLKDRSYKVPLEDMILPEIDYDDVARAEVGTLTDEQLREFIDKKYNAKVVKNDGTVLIGNLDFDDQFDLQQREENLNSPTMKPETAEAIYKEAKQKSDLKRKSVARAKAELEARARGEVKQLNDQEYSDMLDNIEKGKLKTRITQEGETKVDTKPIPDPITSGSGTFFEVEYTSQATGERAIETVQATSQTEAVESFKQLYEGIYQPDGDIKAVQSATVRDQRNEEQGELIFDAKVTYMPKKYTGQEPKEEPPAFFRQFNPEQYEEGRFVDLETKEDLTNKTFESMRLRIVDGKPQMETSDIEADDITELSHSVKTDKGYVKLGRQVKTNLFRKFDRKRQLWKWESKVPLTNADYDTPTLISVDDGQKHYYTLDYEVNNPVKLANYPDSPSEPRGKPTTKGELQFGNLIGYIKVTSAKNPQPVYDRISIGRNKYFVDKDFVKKQQAIPLNEREENFRKWFKDSKIVNKDGSPMVVYHGTNYLSEDSKDIEFKESKIGNAHDDGFYGRGFYFATSMGEASFYGRNIIPTYLSIQNPFDMDIPLPKVPYAKNEKQIQLYDKFVKAGMSDPVFDFVKENYLNNRKRIEEGVDGFTVESQFNGITQSDQYFVTQNGNRILDESNMFSYNGAMSRDDAISDTALLLTEEQAKEKFSKKQFEPIANELGYEALDLEDVRIREALSFFSEGRRRGYSVSVRQLIGILAPERKTKGASEAFSDQLKKKGFDGIKFADEIVAFDSTQIKSVANVGLFAKDNPNIFEAGVSTTSPTNDLDTHYAIKRRPIDVGSTFSGVGTMELGLAQGGLQFNSVFAVEYSPLIIAEHNRIHGTDYDAQSIFDMNPREMLAKNPNLKYSHFHCSPVCKRYSFATIGREITEEELALDIASADSIIDFINVVQTPTFSLENVNNYIKSPEMARIRAALKANGYFVSEDIINTGDLGAIQARERLFVRASKNRQPEELTFDKSEPADWYVALEDLITREVQENPLPKNEFTEVRRGRTRPSYIRALDKKIKRLGGNKPMMHMGGNNTISVAGGPMNTLLAFQDKDTGLPKPQNLYIFVPDRNSDGTFKNMKVVNDTLVDGTAIYVTADMYPRMMGLQDNALYPTDPNLARMLMGNGMQSAMTEKVLVPFLQTHGYIPSIEQTVHEIQSNDLKKKADESFFLDFWPRMIQRTGQVLTSSKETAPLVAEQSNLDLNKWLSENPEFAEYYKNDLLTVRKYLDNLFGRITSEEFNFFKTLLGLTSPNTALPDNVAEALKLFKGYKDFGLYAFEKYLDDMELDPNQANILDNKRDSIKTIVRFAQRFGSLQKSIDFFKDTDTMENLRATKRAGGVYKGKIATLTDEAYIKKIVAVATGQEEQIPRMFMFGPKVGAYTLNLNGLDQFTTTDIWEARFVRSYFADLLQDNYGLPSNAYEKNFMQDFAKFFNEEFNRTRKESGEKELAPSAIQALRWFYILNKTNQAGYEDARTNQTISGYLSQEAIKLFGYDPKGRRPRSSKTSPEIQPTKEEVIEGGFNPRDVDKATDEFFEDKIEEQNIVKYIEGRFDNMISNPALELDGRKLTIVVNPKNYKGAMGYDPYDHVIYIRPKEIRQGGRNTEQGLSALVREEVIHAVVGIQGVKKSPKLLQKAMAGTTDRKQAFADAMIQFYDMIGTKLTPEEREAVETGYGMRGMQAVKNRLSDFKAGAEFLRAVIQENNYDAITEQVSPEYARAKTYKGGAFLYVKKFIKAAQSYLTTKFKKESKYDSEVAKLIIDVSNILQNIDPDLKIANQRTVLEAKMNMSPVTEQLTLNINDVLTTPIERLEGKPVEIEFKPSQKKISNVDAYAVPVGQLLRNISPELETVFDKFDSTIESRILSAHKIVKGLAAKFKKIKDKDEKAKLNVLMTFSPFAPDQSRFSQAEQKAILNKRDAMLIKYNMFNEFKAAQTLLKSFRAEAETIGIDMNFLEEYFPRKLKRDAYNTMLKRAGLDEDTFNKAIRNENLRRSEIEVKEFRVYTYDAETNIEIPGDKFSIRRDAQAEADALGNSFVKEEMSQKPEPPIMPGSAEESRFLQDYINNKGFTPKGKPTFMASRKIELIDIKDANFYEPANVALSNYITSMITHLETVKFSGQGNVVKGKNDSIIFDPGSVIGRTLQRLKDDPNVDQEKLKNDFYQIYKVLMSKTAQVEGQGRSTARFLTYATLLTEPTSSLSQLYDNFVTSYENGFFNSVASMFSKKIVDVRDMVDQDRVMEEFRDHDNWMLKSLKFGLTVNGFRRMDRFMKETNMDANYKKALKVLKDINPDGTIKKGLRGKRLSDAKRLSANINLFFSPNVINTEGEVAEFIVAMKTPEAKRNSRQTSLIYDYLRRKLFETQPLGRLRMPLKAAENPNNRWLYTMRSFMIVQFNYVRNESFKKMAQGFERKDRELFMEGFMALMKLLTYFVLIGIPIDAAKDALVGRPGYLADYTFNGALRAFGVNKYFLYQAKNQGIGQFFLDYTLPVPIAQYVQIANDISQVSLGSKDFMNSRLPRLLPFDDVFYYRLPDQKDRLSDRARRRARGENLGPLDFLERIEPTPTVITREMLGL